METIIEPTVNIDFSNLFLSEPTQLSSGVFFSRIFLNSKKMFVTCPLCPTKAGFITNGKKTHTDLMFTNADTIFINWVEQLVNQCCDLLFEKGNAWFTSIPTRDDIETAFSSPFKVYKSGKFILMRANVSPTMHIFGSDYTKIKTSEFDYHKDYIITIVEIQGIKCTSKNYQLEFEVRQAVITNEDPFADVCLMRVPKDSKDYFNAKSNNIIISGSGSGSGSGSNSGDDDDDDENDISCMVSPRPLMVQDDIGIDSGVDGSTETDATSDENFARDGSATNSPNISESFNSLIAIQDDDISADVFEETINSTSEEGGEGYMPQSSLKLKTSTDIYINRYKVALAKYNQTKSDYEAAELELNNFGPLLMNGTSELESS